MVDGHSHYMLIIDYKSLSLKTHFKVCLKWVSVLPLVNLCVSSTAIALDSGFFYVFTSQHKNENFLI